ncbi:hypothetical protein ACVD1N_00435 [Vibrio parahaemolyticus]|uniref:hypothetical protein n=1 Tax=Vibrio TaxID=662 RepID=UPI000AED589B|nr:hypothetical protein [Vibrio parahaemolyticus]EKO3433960.1 hypothetical protein [Vibrio fluvialis]MCG6229677.1 hypothetical protein [Vibrio furnissii]EJA7356458.1 hypothetical protein [Vibrio parahaemolyticus]EJE4169095.1 hypothetical protein [Vibrio parahaemolyticus]EKH9202977.1 hypothetical protein [Vibrio parahaemolyticus]
MEREFSSNPTDLKGNEGEGMSTAQEELNEKLSRVNKLAEKVIDEMDKSRNDQGID